MTKEQETSKQRRVARREAERRRAEAARRRQRWRRLFWWGGGLVVVAVIVAPRAHAAPTIDGVRCNPSEGGIMHIHQHLALYDRGHLVPLPQDVGTGYSNPFTACLFWMHTHRPDGVIHIESPVQRTFTLGQFFDIWHQPLSRTQAAFLKADAVHPIRAYVNGRLYRGDLRMIPLTEHAQITLEVGPPWVPPTSYSFQGA